MALALITGSCGLVGSEAADFFIQQGFDVIGIDNNMRRKFFGPEGSTAWNKRRLKRKYRNYRHYDIDIRDERAVNRLFGRYKRRLSLIIHAAAQPSHDWAVRNPQLDFTTNANGTLVLLEAFRRFCPKAVFIFISTNKVYGDRPNYLPLREHKTRYEIIRDHPYAEGVDETMSIDDCLHSLFGASKVAADVLTQEYGRYFGLKTGIFRGGCLTGPLHSGAELHGFLSFLVKCALKGTVYKIFGYKGKQVRDNIHSYDLVNAFFHFFQSPRVAEVYNIGGGRFANVSLLEALALCEEICGRKVRTRYIERNRLGDHMWWISDVSKFKSHYPQWDQTYTIRDTIIEIFQARRRLDR